MIDMLVRGALRFRAGNLRKELTMTRHLDLSLSEARETIRRNLEEHGSEPAAPLPDGLALDQIAKAESVFQPRTLEGRMREDMAHLKTLAGAVGTPEKPKFLDPITVWWGGDRWFVIDGHHRIEAYRQVGTRSAVPVTVFLGTLDRAMAHSAASNSKDKLPMTMGDKMNAAWRLVVLTRLTKAEVMEATGVSKGTVDNMRQVKGKLLAHPEDDDSTGELAVTPEELAEKTWKAAKFEASGRELDPNYDPDEAMRKRAGDIAQRLTAAIKDRMFQDTEAFALALVMIDSRLPGMMMETQAWDEALRETVGALRDDYAPAAELADRWDRESDY